MEAWARAGWRVWDLGNEWQITSKSFLLRSLVDEAKGEIWQRKKIFFFYWLLHSTPVQSPLKIYAVFRGKLSSNSSSKLEISAVSEKEKPIRKDERRKNLEVICHSALNNYCNMIVPLSPGQTAHDSEQQFTEVEVASAGY